MYTTTLQDGPLDRAEVGGKAASLSYLIHHGVPVPPGFVVTTKAHQDYLQALRHDQMERPPGDGPIPGPLPEAIGHQIRQGLAQFLPDTRFAVRSSAVFEDLAEASFAGQYDTLLDLGHPQVIAGIQHCWSSAANLHAQTYAQARGMAIEDSYMGVIVQSLVAAETAGVSFSIHPVSGGDQVVINAAYGLGEGVVSGLVTPDTYVIDKTTNHVDQMLGDKECLIRSTPAGGTETVETPASLRSRFSLTGAEVRAVHQLTVLLERLAGYPVDVEWAIARGTLYCLQMRPISLSGGVKA